MGGIARKEAKGVLGRGYLAKKSKGRKSFQTENVES